MFLYLASISDLLDFSKVFLYLASISDLLDFSNVFLVMTETVFGVFDLSKRNLAAQQHKA